MPDHTVDLPVPTGDQFDGFAVFVVGGAVRDALRGLDPEDIDLMAVPRPGEVDDPVEVLADRMWMVDPESTIPVFHDNHGREVALPRTEQNAGDGHKGFDMAVVPAGTPVEQAVRTDLERRDLTVNAMAVNARTGGLFDPHGGRQDLEDGVVRHVSEAFREDPLRVVRLARFAARLGATVAPETMELAREVAQAPVSLGTQLEVIARSVADSDPEVAQSLRAVADELPDGMTRSNAVDMVEQAIEAGALAQFDVIPRLQCEMAQVEALPTERVTKEFRKAVRQAEAAGRFFEVLAAADTLAPTFPGLAAADVPVEAVAETVTAARNGTADGRVDAVLTALGGLLGDAADAVASHQALSRQEQAAVMLGQDALGAVVRFDRLDARRAVDVFGRIAGDRGPSVPAVIGAAAADARRRPVEGFDRAAVERRVSRVRESFEAVDGQRVMDETGVTPADVGGEAFGDLLAEERARRLNGG